MELNIDEIIDKIYDHKMPRNEAKSLFKLEINKLRLKKQFREEWYNKP